MKKKGIVYIDGYNWYHAIFKHKPEWKWINLQTFFTALRSDEDIVLIKMFSSWIKHEPEAEERQKRYFEALGTLPKVKMIYGIFQPREVTCRSDCNKKYIVQEEKKTDVNIAVEIITDALNGACDKMFIVSGDSDLHPAIEWVAKNKPDIKITVLIPALPKEESMRRTDFFRTSNIAVDVKFLPIGNIADHQFKNYVKKQDGTFAIRPHSWKKEEQNDGQVG